jgi:hypothetical protein
VGGRDEGERQTRCRIGELAENLREIAGALPFWRVDDSGLGIVVVATGLDEPLSDTSRRGQYHNTGTGSWPRKLTSKTPRWHARLG